MSSADSDRFYNEEYTSGLTTDLLSDDSLAMLRASRFRDSAKDFTRYIRLIKALGFGPRARILDFGSSWGYGTWQLRQAGFEVVGFEVALDRAAYAREKLSAPVVSQLSEVEGMFDVVFSAHVIEHVPAVQSTFEFCMDRLRTRGQLVAITPNGSEAFRRRRPSQWNRMWGLKHPNFLDAEFYRHFFRGKKHLLSSSISGLGVVADWRRGQQSVVEDLSGWELLAICEK